MEERKERKITFRSFWNREGVLGILGNEVGDKGSGPEEGKPGNTKESSLLWQEVGS